MPDSVTSGASLADCGQHARWSRPGTGLHYLAMFDRRADGRPYDASIARPVHRNSSAAVGRPASAGRCRGAMRAAHPGEVEADVGTRS